MTMIIDGTLGETFPDGSLQPAAASPYVLRNRIINGAMVINQRGFSGTPTDGAYTLDRWYADMGVASKFTVSQNAGSVTPPAGFVNYLGVTSSSSYSISATDIFTITQRIEGYNISDFAWGTASAKTVTLSFQVYSSLTGTFGGTLRNNGNSRCYPFTYTISSANTWTTISITIAGDTSGTWLTTNGNGLAVTFGLGVGSTYSGTAGSWSGSTYFSATGATSVVGTNGATFYITGVQLEQNTSATPFERRLYNQELANCQRYLYATGSSSASYQMTGGTGSAGTSAEADFSFTMPVTMRSTPTLTATSGAAFRAYDFNSAPAVTGPTIFSGNASNTTQVAVYLTGTVTQYRPYFLQMNNGYLFFSAEL